MATSSEDLYGGCVLLPRIFFVKLISVLATMLLLAGSSASAMEVKGLKLGMVTDADQLALIFGSARCDAIAVSSLPIACRVPISFLGVLTNADVYIEQRGHRVEQLDIRVPSDQLSGIEALFKKKYGEPKTLRGAVRPVSSTDLKTGQTVTGSYKEECTTWNGVEDSDIAICNAIDPLPGLDFPYVRYTYKPSSALDTNDL